jgi:hypothetical protein
VTSRLATLTTAAGLAFACGHAPPPLPSLRGGDVASVGDLPIPASLVADVARASRISPRAAVDRLVEDALAAEEARARGMDRAGALPWAVTAILARRVPQRLMDQARSAGPPADDELAALIVAHAIVVRTPGVPEERSRATAEEIRRAVSGARSAEDFEARARAVPNSGTQVVVERLQAFGADGRSAAGVQYDPTFVAAAFALPSSGQISWIVETPFGWHTIYLVDRSPADPGSIEQRRTDLASAVVLVRARIRTASLLRARKERSSIDVSEAADALMADAARAP